MRLIHPWAIVGEANLPAISKDDEDLFVASFTQVVDRKHLQYLMEKIVRRQPKRFFTIACTLFTDFDRLMDIIVEIINDRGYLLDIRFASGPDAPFISILPRENTEATREKPANQICIGEVKAFVGIGMGGMAPTIVIVRLQKQIKDQTSITITGISGSTPFKQFFKGRQVAYLVAQWIEEYLQQDIAENA
ncbi:hypothetical protein KDH_76950 [Dictyobacter sp. S3.2.2.5]|uniref:Uncharacterized protein n=1 Tax=Dictyobacter halimunensis TaxID=3026934 RepID=A0ABQ6G7U7_9CHLR|nr:hypothetical protein KDH_76950 [Dictyobacter sp. S3.2.2.5]